MFYNQKHIIKAKNHFSAFCWVGFYFIEKKLTQEHLLDTKNCTGQNKRPYLRSTTNVYAWRTPLPDVRTTSQEWRPDPKIVKRHDDLFARAWKTEFEQPSWDNDRSKPSLPISLETIIESDYPIAEVCSIPGTIRESSQENFIKQTDYITERMRITTGAPIWKIVQSNRTLFLVIHEVQNMTCIIIWSRIVLMIRDKDSVICSSTFHRLYAYTFQKIRRTSNGTVA